MRLLRRSRTVHDFQSCGCASAPNQTLSDMRPRDNPFSDAPKNQFISSSLGRMRFNTNSPATFHLKRRHFANSGPTKLGSLVVGTLSRVAQLQLGSKTKTAADPFLGNKAAESCYRYIKETLSCEDTDQLATALENPPLPQFIRQILEVNKVPDSFVEVVMLLIHRYYLLVRGKVAQNRNRVSGHLIFLCAYLTAALIYYEPGSFGFFIHYCMEQSNYPENTLTSIQKLFQAKVDPESSLDFYCRRADSGSDFSILRVADNDAEWLLASPTQS